MSETALFEQLQRLQVENAALHERISDLKRQTTEQDSSPDDSESEAYAAEISALKAQIVCEQQETLKLKQELTELIKCQEALQARIETDSALVVGTLTPLVQREEQETQAYYDRLLAKCATIPGVDVPVLRELVAGVQQKRKILADATAENQKIHRLIALNRAQLTDAGVPPPQQERQQRGVSVAPMPGKTAKVSASPTVDVFENPLPCLAENAPAAGPGGTRRRRVLFKGRDAV
jgi:hypothetical protein